MLRFDLVASVRLCYCVSSVLYGAFGVNSMGRSVNRGFRSVPMERDDYFKCKRVIDHAMSCEGGLRGDGHGVFQDIESAIGALVMGQMYGYRVLELVHSAATRNKYCKLLGIGSFREVCRATGVYSQRHYLFRVMGTVSDWWRGRHNLPRVYRSQSAVVDTGG